ncbi:C5a anaphylatoxin chemotactic receptor 1 [Rhineura floridana]|uniref:C5a anaphylatoxin chemotactic receptor 1 n=1 Tax=Rhineura floridana TaxID=261503 RepID=UPI002AC8363A|nr:C5a anaphylatoxin chemotactic receptor 1 [Rhineura floridana]
MDDFLGFNDSYDYANYGSSNYTSVDMNCMNSLNPLIWLALILYALVFLVGVLGNGAVIWVVGFQMRRTVNTAWFLNLSVADLLCCLALPFLAVPLASDHCWKLGNFACKLFPSLTILNMFASILLLVLISIDRCALVVKPVWCQNHRSPRLAWMLCGLAWAFALLLTLPSFFSRRTQLHGSKTTCGIDYSIFGGDSRMAELSVVTMRFLFGFLIPFMVICICYGLLISRVRNSRFMRSRKTLKVVLVVIVGFFVCWAPYHVAGLILASEPSSSPLFQSVNKADALVVALAYINSCINPIIYVIGGQDFKTKMRHSLKGLLRNVLSDESVLANSLAEGHGAQATCLTTEDRSTSTTV